MRSMVALLAVIAIILAPGVHGAAHSQCVDGTEVSDPKIGSCPAFATKFTPSSCKTVTQGGQSMNFTKALVDTTYQATMTAAPALVADDAACKAQILVAQAGCPADKVKAGVGCDWACAMLGRVTLNTFGCNKDTNCAASVWTQSPACESMTAMLTAVCDQTEAEIKTIVDGKKTAGACKAKADGGVEFALPTVAVGTTAPTTTPAPSAASSASPLWTLALVCMTPALSLYHKF